MSGDFTLALLGALGLLLVAAAIGDLRSRTIPNGLNGAIAGLAVLWWIAIGLPLWPGVALQIGIAVAVLLLFWIAFHFGMMGGGDVKMLAALALWLPPVPLVRMLVAMALLGGLVTLAAVAFHRWRNAEGAVEVPYGVAISMAAMWAMTNDILTTQAS